jgi:hypothetical protein
MNRPEISAAFELNQWVRRKICPRQDEVGRALCGFLDSDARNAPDFLIRKQAAGPQQAGEAAVTSGKLGKAAHLDDAAIVEEDHEVSIPNRRKAVRDDEGRAVSTQAVDRILDPRFGLDVERTGRLV